MERVSQNPQAPDFVQDPYPFYEHARALGEIVWWEEYNLPIAVSAKAVSAILKDRRMGRAPISPNEPPPHLKDFYAVEAHSMLELEPPTHTRLRGNVLRAFTSARVQAMAPEIAQIADDLIARFPKTGSFDLLEYYAEPLPVTVIAKLLGMPVERGNDMRRWSNQMVAMYQASRTRADEEAANTAAAEFSAFVREYIALRRNCPSDDLLTALIRAEEAGTRLSTDELVTTVILLMNAGHEATVHAIGNGVTTLLKLGTDRKALNPSFLAATVEELLRYDPPLHMFTRYVYEDFDVCGHHFSRGDQIACMLAAANRDPANYADPAVFDPTRPAMPNASFGAGIHFCVGAPLARLEMQVALPLLFARCPNLNLARDPKYSNTYHFHGLDQLTVSCATPTKAATVSST
ncbi:MAG: cytochrome P450 [Rhodobacteraceae bacterium]|nr:cytochrome P450 [Paracoccaceae bacterium]